MMYLYIGYYAGCLPHIHTEPKKLENMKVEPYECHTMNEVIYILMKDDRTKGNILRKITDKDVFIFKDWNITIAHKVLINHDQVWIENEQGELELL